MWRPILHAFLPLALCSPVPAADWTTYMGDASRSGIAKESLVPPLTEIWSFRTPLPPQPAWPDAAKWDGWHKVWDLKTRMTFDRCYHVVAAGDAVYFGSSSNDQVYCLDAGAGKKRWSVFTEGPVRLAPVFHKGRLYFGSDDGLLYCVRAKDGSIVWAHRAAPEDRRVSGNGRVISVWPVRGGPVIYGDTVYAAAGTFPLERVFVFALDIRNGSTVWKTTMDDLPAQGYLLASATRLYVPSGRNNPIVFDRSNGRRLRVVDGLGGSYCLLSGDQIVFGPGRTGQLGLVDREEQDQLATFAGNRMIVSPGLSYLHTDTDLRALDRRLYLDLARKRRPLLARRDKINEALKKLEKKDKRSPQVTKLKEQLVLVSEQIDLLSKKMQGCFLWKVPCAAPYALVLSGRKAARGTLYAGGDGRLVALAGKDGRETWKGRVEGKVLGLAIANGRLYASTDRGVIHCFKEAR